MLGMPTHSLFASSGRLALLAAAAALLAACITVEADRRPPFHVTRTSDQVVWVAREAQDVLADGVLLDELSLRSPTGRLAAVSSVETQAALVAGCRQAFEAALAGSLPLVSLRAAGVVELQPGLSDAVDEPILQHWAQELGPPPGAHVGPLVMSLRVLHGPDRQLLACLASTRESPRLLALMGEGAGPEAFAREFAPLAARLLSAIDRNRAFHEAFSAP